MGKKQLQEMKDKGEVIEGSTFGRNHKQAFEKSGKEVVDSKR